jgi:hypothetical protein
LEGGSQGFGVLEWGADMKVDPVLGEVNTACDVKFDKLKKKFFSEVLEFGFWDWGDGVES